MPAKSWIAAALTLCAASAVTAGTCEITSAPTHTPLVELYTSEGCSSCPPADRWLSTLRDRTDVVALAFHVDYWDYIGWTDRFADARNSQRQRDWARQTGAGTIYTPQILVDGSDARAWRGGDPLKNAATGATAVARIALKATTTDTGTRIEATASAPGERNSRIVVARFEHGHQSEVNAGENSGRQLRHDYVVRDWNMQALSPDGRVRAQWHFLPGERPGGFAAFVQDATTGEVLQSVALNDCP